VTDDRRQSGDRLSSVCRANCHRPIELFWAIRPFTRATQATRSTLRSPRGNWESGLSIGIHTMNGDLMSQPKLPAFITKALGENLAKADEDDLKDMITACLQGLRFTECNDLNHIRENIPLLPTTERIDLLITLAKKLRQRLRSEVQP
jgi:hypothetical protein